ncbi:BglG family transcription antiterminator LicT [Treponema brennaborense]|uniref:Transcriptional antiterminator, BglG n=1 Tax=Treponema brennaborense (strain DSM 12168 / CIP 105900 / DD5/3) TaxID=906968 RepID=F4LLZ8_TREBD|nr:PRD domain-containing protein [Treponema brennaborense]AEE15690.1 transcriptional antiterminator, BglG [Treponema brennaborense DSM 12168]
MILKIIKILNNNAAVCTDPEGFEKIVMGRGLAFQQKCGAVIDESKIEKIFILKNEETNFRFQEFIQNIPIEDMLLSEEIIAHAKKLCPKELHDSIYITLTDHLNAAMERAKQNIAVTSPITSAIKSFYPEEFRIGLDALDIIKKATGRSFSIDEAAFITMHFVTAELGAGSPELNSMLEFVQDVSILVKRCLPVKIDETSPAWQRFLVHLSFFAQRIMTASGSSDGETELYDSIAKTFPAARNCVDRITAYVEEKYPYTVDKNEKTYLTIHINRIVTGKE